MQCFQSFSQTISNSIDQQEGGFSKHSDKYRKRLLLVISPFPKKFLRFLRYNQFFGPRKSSYMKMLLNFDK